MPITDILLERNENFRVWNRCTSDLPADYQLNFLDNKRKRRKENSRKKRRKEERREGEGREE